ncbi:hypothetical protein WAI453_007912 [Rhynchosporium graminicola]
MRISSQLPDNTRLILGDQPYNVSNETLSQDARELRTDTKILAFCNIMCLYKYDSAIGQRGGCMEPIEEVQSRK